MHVGILKRKRQRSKIVSGMRIDSKRSDVLLL